MLDIKFIKENKDVIKEAAKNKNIKLDLDRLIKLHEQKNRWQNDIDDLRAKRNQLSHQSKGSQPTTAQIKEGREIKSEISSQEKRIKNLDLELNNLLVSVPNVYSEDTPIGKDESGNKILRKFKTPSKFSFQPKDHMELGILHGIIDTEKSSVISGSRFNYLFGDAVLLQFALIQFIFATLTNKNIIQELADKVGNPFGKPFTPVLPPVMAKSEIMKKMDRFDPIEDRYYLKNDDVLLVGSAEHTLGPIHMNEIFDENELPVRYIGYSTAFRREAGSYGKDTSGILRRHQFDKAEMETFVQPEFGLKEQNLIIAVQEYLVTKLDIPYQVVAICTGDMGKPDFRQVDIECWMPGQNKYRETHTSDYMTDYQARRLNIKYKKKDGTKELIHMNDATAFAMGRILIAILENYQQENGSILIPEVLKKYMPENIQVIAKNN